jgi:hypothetical protein
MRMMQRSTAFRRSAFAAAFLVLTALACAGQQGPGRSTAPLPSDPEELLAELRAHKERADQATQGMLQRVEAFNASRQPGQRTIDFGEIFAEGLDDEQRRLLNRMLAEEKDVSYKALLERIVADVDRIRVLQEKLSALEQALPDAYVVARPGDTHNDLALEFLRVKAALDEAKAREVLARTDRTDELVPGNRVWFSYNPADDAFRTYVTRGDATMTPLALRRARQRVLTSERDRALATVEELEAIRASLENDITTLRQRRSALEAANAGLEARNAELRAGLEQVSGDLAFQKNSVFYHVANARDLKERKVLTPVLKRVRDVRGVRFDAALDLRRGTQIRIDPNRFGLRKIDEVRLLPPIYREGRDFKIEVSRDRSAATVTFLDSELFRGKEILLAVGG